MAPRIRFLQKSQKKPQKSSQDSDEEDDSDESDNQTQKKSVAAKKTLFRKDESDAFNFSELTKHDDNDDSLFTVKHNVQLKFNGPESEHEEEDNKGFQRKIKIKTKASIVKQLKKKNIKVNEKVEFDDDGNVGQINLDYFSRL